jgi:hypothetical protein
MAVQPACLVCGRRNGLLFELAGAGWFCWRHTLLRRRFYGRADLSAVREQEA